MKEVIKDYFYELFLCFLIGFIAALAKFVSPWLVVLMVYPICKYWVIGKIARGLQENIESAGMFISIAFLSLVAVFVISAFIFPEESFLAVTAGGTVFSALIVTVILLFWVNANQPSRSK